MDESRFGSSSLFGAQPMESGAAGGAHSAAATSGKASSKRTRRSAAKSAVGAAESFDLADSLPDSCFAEDGTLLVDIEGLADDEFEASELRKRQTRGGERGGAAAACCTGAGSGSGSGSGVSGVSGVSGSSVGGFRGKARSIALDDEAEDYDPNEHSDKDESEESEVDFTTGAAAAEAAPPKERAGRKKKNKSKPGAAKPRKPHVAAPHFSFALDSYFSELPAAAALAEHGAQAAAPVAAPLAAAAAAPAAAAHGHNAPRLVLGGLPGPAAAAPAVIQPPLAVVAAAAAPAFNGIDWSRRQLTGRELYILRRRSSEHRRLGRTGRAELTRALSLFTGLSTEHINTYYQGARMRHRDRVAKRAGRGRGA